MSNYISNYSGSQIDNVIDLFHGKGLDQVTGLVQRNADGTFSQGSGGGGSDVFIAEYNVTTYAELLAAINANKRIIIKKTEGYTQNDVLYYVNKYELVEDDGQPYLIRLDAIGYNSHFYTRVMYSNSNWQYSDQVFLTYVNPSVYNIIYNSSDYDYSQISTNLYQIFTNRSESKAFIYDDSSNTNGVGLILSYNETHTSTYNRIEFTALFCSVSTSDVYKVKYRIEQNASTGKVTWSRQKSTQLQDKLVSGTSIKTFNNQSLLGSGNISETDPVFVASAASGISASDITNWNSKSDFSGSFIDLTNKPTTLSGYGITDAQETLVSGTNIKTINNTSLLGSGNISVQETLVSGTNIKTINNNSILGSGNINTTDHIFIVTPNVTTYNELLAAIQAGKYLCVHNYDDYENNLYWIQFAEDDDNIYLDYFNHGSKIEYKVSSSNVWTKNFEYIILTENSTLSASKLSGTIPASVTATTQSSGDNSTKIATTAYVDSAIDNLPEPMVFEGSLGTGGTITTLPTASSTNKGFTYKVITDGTYASQAAKVGDTFISDGTAWVLIPSGDEPSGTVTSVATGAGLTGGPVTSSGTIKVNLVSETSQGTIGTTDKLYAVGVDSTGALCVSVPWTGTVTSIATGSGLSGGPITSSGTISLATAFGDTVNPYGSKTANYVLAAPNGSNGTPSFRALVTDDIPATINPTANTISKFDSSAHMNSTDMSSSEVTSFINGLNLTGSKAVDYIVEQGISGIWTYRKWQSGIAECWGKTEVPSHSYPAGGALSIQETLPINLFIAGPIINTSGGIAGTIKTDTCYVNAQGNNKFETYLVNSNLDTPVTAVGWVYWQIRGRWK